MKNESRREEEDEDRSHTCTKVSGVDEINSTTTAATAATDHPLNKGCKASTTKLMSAERSKRLFISFHDKNKADKCGEVK